jgi:hypothetical protein
MIEFDPLWHCTKASNMMDTADIIARLNVERQGLALGARDVTAMVGLNQ